MHRAGVGEDLRARLFDPSAIWVVRGWSAPVGADGSWRGLIVTEGVFGGGSCMGMVERVVSLLEDGGRRGAK